jgi:hypothetical protein
VIIISNQTQNMKKKKIIIIFFILLTACKSENNVCSNLKIGEVCIKIINESGYKIKLLELNHERGIKNIVNLKNGDEKYTTIYCPGEGSYIIKAVFDDNKIVKSKENYIEGGYRMTEIIHRDSIKSVWNEY